MSERSDGRGGCRPEGAAIPAVAPKPAARQRGLARRKTLLTPLGATGAEVCVDGVCLVPPAKEPVDED